MTRPVGGGDPYFPEFGTRSYAVSHYDLSLDYRVDANHLDGRVEVHARAEVDLEEIELDLRGLQVRKVRLDGHPVERFKHRRGKLVVRCRTPVRRGTDFTVSVRYAGHPRPIPDGNGGMGWEELSDGVLVAGQTNGAGSWFPCNDRPDDKASYRFEVTTGSAYHVVANGELLRRTVGAGTTTWTYEQREPMATYLATVQIGRYVARDVPDAPVPVTAVLPAHRLEQFAEGFGRQAEMVRFFTDRFGRYPFGGYTVVVTDDPLEIPLEAQTLSVFGSNFLSDDWDAVRLVAHELAHQWFGNSLTAASWRDIWLHEGFACYAEWLWSEESGGASAEEWAQRHWDRLAEAPQDLVLGDPGPADMFDDRVYKRGACLVHALRATVGEQTFWHLVREWARRHEHGSVTTDMFIGLAEEVAGQELRPLFRSWLHEPALPPLPRRCG